MAQQGEINNVCAATHPIVCTIKKKKGLKANNTVPSQMKGKKNEMFAETYDVRYLFLQF